MSHGGYEGERPDYRVRPQSTQHRFAQTLDAVEALPSRDELGIDAIIDQAGHAVARYASGRALIRLSARRRAIRWRFTKHVIQAIRVLGFVTLALLVLNLVAVLLDLQQAAAVMTTALIVIFPLFWAILAWPYALTFIWYRRRQRAVLDQARARFHEQIQARRTSL